MRAAGVSRDHLSKPLRSDAWVLKKELQQHLRTQRVFRQSRHSNIRGLRRGQIIDGVPIAHRSPEVEDRAVPGALGRRPHCRTRKYLHRDSRRAALQVYDARESQRQGDKTVVTALSTQVRKASTPAPSIVDLGSRHGTREPQELHPGDGHPGVFLRSPKPLATRHQRKHKPTAFGSISQRARISRHLRKPSSTGLRRS
jgi:hypothetical protein